MNISYEYYKTFCIVAESKSITEAAKRLNISQPAITKTIKLLESELNSVLFYRKHSGMSLTLEGERLYSYIKPIILQLDDTKNIMNEIVNKGKTNIRIGTSITVLRSFLIKYIKKYMLEHPNVHIYVEDNTNNNLITKIKEGSIDLAVIISNTNYSKKYVNCPALCVLLKVGQLATAMVPKHYFSPDLSRHKNFYIFASSKQPQT